MAVIRFAAIFFVSVIIAVWNPRDSSSMDLRQFQWKNRLFFIFAEDGSHPLFKDLQNQIIAQKAEVDDRDLIVFEVPAQGPARMNSMPLDRKKADSIRNHFAVSDDAFSLILVGKDGSIKLQRNERVDLTDVFGLIDSMPMRQREIKQKSQ